jgi:amidase
VEITPKSIRLRKRFLKEHERRGSMKRFLLLACLTALSSCAHSPGKKFNVVEATIPQMQQAMAAGTLMSRELIRLYLDRIAAYDSKLNAVITVNPRALEEADARDRDRAQGRVRGPLHGIPIALKDNIHTTDMPTTGGALAFEGFVPPYEATLVKSLREAGAVIIAKTAMTEWANWMAGPPTPMVAGYFPIRGFSLNPYDPRRDPRPTVTDGRPVLFPGGSSSGVGTAANLWAANVGTETSGSLLSPANLTMLVAIKPTVGRISRYGIIPLTADQDTAGPMARSVGMRRCCWEFWRMRSRIPMTRSRPVSHRRGATIRSF